MTARSLAPARCRFAWLMLVVAALLARAVAPEGWMPVASPAGGIEITLCNGDGPTDAMVLTPDGKLHHKAPGQGLGGDHPCAFAGIGLADASPPTPVIANPIRPAIVAPALAAIGMLPGRGLAAPPPPATGPPALA